MAESPRVSVVIPSWNCLEDLKRCLASLEAQEGVEVQTFVVDNGSEDGTPEFLAEQGVPHLSLPRNLGFAAAVNFGIARTGAPLVMVLNEDTVLEPDCLLGLAAALEANPALGGVQPLILQLQRDLRQAPDDPATIVYSHGQSLTRDGRAREDGAGRRRSETTIAAREVFGVCGAACLLRRTMLEALDGYDESYFAFYEDVDLNVRARIAGWHFALVPDAQVWHVGNAAWRASFKRPGAENARLVARNRLATRIKFMPIPSIPRIVAVETGSLLLALAHGRLRSALFGRLETLRRLPALLGERRRLRATGDPSRARAWLGVGWAQGRAGLETHPGTVAPRRGREDRSERGPQRVALSSQPQPRESRPIALAQPRRQ